MSAPLAACKRSRSTMVRNPTVHQPFWRDTKRDTSPDLELRAGAGSWPPRGRGDKDAVTNVKVGRVSAAPPLSRDATAQSPPALIHRGVHSPQVVLLDVPGPSVRDEGCIGTRDDHLAHMVVPGAEEESGTVCCGPVVTNINE
eukprot:6194932-Pleurochrysis_carterae.AAC.5